MSACGRSREYRTGPASGLSMLGLPGEVSCLAQLRTGDLGQKLTFAKVSLRKAQPQIISRSLDLKPAGQRRWSSLIACIILEGEPKQGSTDEHEKDQCADFDVVNGRNHFRLDEHVVHTADCQEEWKYQEFALFPRRYTVPYRMPTKNSFANSG